MQTMRNWLIGYYIVEFEQHGKDRAEYGTQLLKKLEGVNVTLFKNSRNFYLHYPQMAENLIPSISPTLSDQFQTSGKKIISSLSFSHIVEVPFHDI